MSLCRPGPMVYSTTLTPRFTSARVACWHIRSFGDRTSPCSASTPPRSMISCLFSAAAIKAIKTTVAVSQLRFISARISLRSSARTVHREVTQRSRHLGLQLDGFRARAVDDGLEATVARDLNLVCVFFHATRFVRKTKSQAGNACGDVPLTARFARAAIASTATPICLELASAMSGLMPPAFAMRSLLSTVRKKLWSVHC